MGPIDLVVFDLAGTTVDDGGGIVLQSMIDTAQDYGLDADRNELNGLMGMNKREVFGMLAARRYGNSGPNADRVADEALDDFVGRMQAEYRRSLSPVPGAEDAFVFLRERGIKIATDTGFDAAITAMIMEGLRWPGRLIDTAVCSSDVPRGRPAPYMVFRAMEQLDIMDVRRVMKIGDSPADLEEGTNAGCAEVIGVLSGAHTVATLGRYPHTRLLPSVADLPALFT